MRVAVFGGSFNPPHIGHGMIIQWLLLADKADKVLVIPSEGHPLKKNRPADVEFRETLLLAMLSDMNLDNRAHVLRAEQDLPKPVYSYDLLHHLKERNPDDELFFVVGTDILNQAHEWHRWEDLAEEFPLIILGREGYGKSSDNPTFSGWASSRIRDLMQKGDPRWKEMVTPSVRKILALGLPFYSLGLTFVKT